MKHFYLMRLFNVLLLLSCVIGANAFEKENPTNNFAVEANDIIKAAGQGTAYQSKPIYYEEPNLHLYFTINEETKEAILGTCTSDEYNALAYNSFDYEENSEREKQWANIVVPSTITYLDETYTVVAVSTNAFYRTTVVHSVSLPETIKEIGSSAFSWCVNLKQINIPSQVTSIARTTFYLCYKLESVVLPPNVKSIGSAAFGECWALKKISIPGNCTIIENDAFCWCTSLSHLILEDGEEPLECGYNYGLSINYEGDGTLDKPRYRGIFADLPRIDTLYLGRTFVCPTYYKGQQMRPFLSISNYGNTGTASPRAYTGKAFGEIVFGDNIEEIQDSLFWASSVNSPIVLPSNLKSIGKHSFYSGWINVNQDSLVIPEKVSHIGDYAFKNNLIKKLIILGSCEELGLSPFYDCRIEELFIGKDVKSIADFSSNDINYIKCLPTTPPYPSNQFGTTPIIVSAGAGGLYRQQWEGSTIIDYSDEIVTINVKTPGTFYSRLLAQDYQTDNVYKIKLKGTINEDDLNILSSMKYIYSYDLSDLNMSELPSGFFKDMGRLFNIQLPNKLTIINDDEFRNCTRLEGTITIPETCGTVGKFAFANSNIDGISCLGDVSINNKAFSACSNLRSVDFKGSVTVGDSVFYAAGIENIDIPTASTLSSNAFSGSNLKKIVLSDGILCIGDGALGDNISSITFNGIVDSIGKHIYPNLKEIYVVDIETWCQLPFPDTEIMEQAPLLYIGNELAENLTLTEDIDVREYAFYNCSTLRTIDIHSGVSTIPIGLFKNCTGLTNVVLPSNITKIGFETFSGCTSLTNLDIPSKVEELEDSAFCNCIKLSKVILPTSLNLIGDGVFYNCKELQSIEFPSMLLDIGSRAFANCNSLKKLKLPVSITDIGEEAFTLCSNLKEVIVEWQEPIIINGNTFSGVSQDCYLYVPIMTANKYIEAGWNFPNLKERGILNVLAKGEGVVIYAENSVRNNSDEFLFPPYRSFYITITPDKGHSIYKVKLNGENVTQLLEDGKLFIEEPEENLEVSIIFADNSIKSGDVNGDGVVDEDDVIDMMYYIVKDDLDVFYEYVSDANGDDIINVTDVIILINNIKNRIK